MDGVYPDLVPVIQRHRVGEVDQRALGHVVGGLVPFAAQCGHGPDVDDASAHRPQVRQCCARGEEGAVDVGPHHGPVAVQVDPVDGAGNRHPRVVDQHVQAPEPLGHAVHGHGDGGEIRDVRHPGVQLRTRRALLGGAPEGRLGAAHEHHGVPVGGEPVRGRGSDAGTGARDDGHGGGILLAHEMAPPAYLPGRSGGLPPHSKPRNIGTARA